jgi:hypothetical protein
MEDFECDSFYDMDLDLDWDSEDILSSAIQECDIGDLDEVCNKPNFKRMLVDKAATMYISM